MNASAAATPSATAARNRSARSPDVERAIGLQPGIGGVPVPPEAGRAGCKHRPAKRVRRDVHDVLENPAQIFMQERRQQHGDEAADRVEGHPAEMAVPVDGGEGGDGLGVGAKDVEGGAERPLDHGGRSVHGGCASGVNQRAGRREPTAPSIARLPPPSSRGGRRSVPGGSRGRALFRPASPARLAGANEPGRLPPRFGAPGRPAGDPSTSLGAAASPREIDRIPTGSRGLHGSPPFLVESRRLCAKGGWGGS